MARALLDRPVTEKLKTETATLVAEGWNWIETTIDLTYGYSHGLRRLAGDLKPTRKARPTRVSLPIIVHWRRRGSVKANTPTRSAWLAQLGLAMDAFEQRSLFCGQGDILRAGVFVTLDRGGSLAVYRGYVRPEDEPCDAAWPRKAAFWAAATAHICPVR